MENNLETIKDLNPHLLWRHFATLASIPRPSKKEQNVGEWLREFASELGLKYKQDKVGNIVIYKDRQNSKSNKTLLLQGHQDMVCEADPGNLINFDTDPIELRIEGDYVYANHTTLGSDNGIGVCAILCILEDKDISHPKMEALFTIDEETGMTGIMELGEDMIHADFMLNLDTEEDGSVYIGCAGSRDITIHNTFTKESELRHIYSINISGLRGGHSGVQINENRGNAIKILTQILFDISTHYPIHISQINGGNKLNAIPRNSNIEFAITNEVAEVNEISEVSSIISYIQSKIQEFEQNYVLIEKDLKITFEDLDKESTSFSLRDSQYIIHTLNAIPSGVIQMNSDIPHLVQTSNNLSVVKTSDNEITIICMHRSSDLFELNNVSRQILSIVIPQDTIMSEFIFSDLSSHKIEVDNNIIMQNIELSNVSIPWKPEPHNILLDSFQEVHKNLFGVEAEVKAVHAGVECGFVRSYLKECKIISFGPQIDDAHSPKEHVQISNVEKFYTLLVNFIEKINSLE